ncbi:hypothetical protein ANN_27224 [Periplaneta americana]|uniref:Uncharacterized protein n=1 Tax=Periplaneta americana TaxID=6978 RepID=A0ABQ8RXP8_PERAM|nr:hypothetical protein ANN_27224 [Periplaneta americana]
MASWTVHRENSGVSSAGQRASAYPPNDSTWMDAAAASGITLELVCKLPNTDHHLETAFSQLTPDKLNNIFLTLQSHLIEIMKVNDGNNNKIPHMQKGHMDHLSIGVSSEHLRRGYSSTAVVDLWF